MQRLKALVFMRIYFKIFSPIFKCSFKTKVPIKSSNSYFNICDEYIYTSLVSVHMYNFGALNSFIFPHYKEVALLRGKVKISRRL